MSIRFFCLLLLVIMPLTSSADELTAKKKADIEKLLVVTGAAKIGVQFAGAVTDNLSKAIKAARPDIPDRVFDVLKQEMVNLFEEKMHAPGGMMELIIPVYDKHFTDSDIRELTAFYQTRVGRKAIEVLPQVMNEGMQIGQAWGQSLAPEINRRVTAVLKNEGIEMPSNSPAK